MVNDATFANGHVACHIEAIFHFSGIMLQFFSIALGGWRNYNAVVYGRIMSEKKSLIFIILATLISVCGTILTSEYSLIYLMPSGLYCLFEFQVYKKLAFVLILSLCS